MALKSLVVDNKEFEISYEIINPSCKQDVVILHGWDSNKDIMKNSFSSFLKDFRHIYIDLPGFGKSLNEKYVLNSEDYMKIINSFLKLLNFTNDIIIGHSFGGKIATLLNPKNLVLLSSAGILEKKPFNVRLKIKLTKILNAFGLNTITKVFRSEDVNKMNEVMYASFKNVINENFTQIFSNFKNKAHIFWGEKDDKTSLESGKKIALLVHDSTFVSYDADHFFFVKYAKDICERIENGIL